MDDNPRVRKPVLPLDAGRSLDIAVDPAAARSVTIP
jgi:hypothetical protein